MAEGNFAKDTSFATGLSAVAANGSSAAVVVPTGQFETAVWASSTGAPTTANVSVDCSFNGGTSWYAFGTTVTATVNTVGASVQLPVGVTHVRHTLSGLAGGTAPTVSSQFAFRQRL